MVWHDKKRDRDVPVKIYYPKDVKGPVPLIIFSHGLGGSRDGYSYLGNEWASHGYVSAHVQHLGSDTAALKTAMTGGLQEALKPYAASNRIVDIYYAIGALDHMNGDPGRARQDRYGSHRGRRPFLRRVDDLGHRRGSHHQGRRSLQPAPP